MNTELMEAESPQDLIRVLQQELTQTNREVLLLTVELDKRVEERTAELHAAQDQLLKKNAELLRRTAQLEAANKEMEAFSYSVSHDLRAPLRHIAGFLNLMLQDTGSNFSETARNYAQRVLGAVSGMGKLIDDLLAFSRTSRAEMHQTRFPMREVVDEAIQGMADDMQHRNILWDIRPMPTVSGDRSLIRQVWVNLLSNAIKYTRLRDPARIEITGAPRKDECEFSVRDNGVGFDMNYVDKVFGVFQRLHTADEFEGTGIGLANVRQIVMRHGGRTWAEGEIGKGAAFYFTLPA
jgi:light-regulated signal transduction histidine kinase (bacteriophytochrome)